MGEAEGHVAVTGQARPGPVVKESAATSRQLDPASLGLGGTRSAGPPLQEFDLSKGRLRASRAVALTGSNFPSTLARGCWAMSHYGWAGWEVPLA